VPEGRIAAMRRVLHQVRSRGLADPLEVDLVAADGRSIPVAWVCSPMHDAGGAITGLVAVGRDLTERRAFEAQSLRWEKLAALGVMAGGIAHEVRNPLAVISSAAQLLLEVPLSKEVERECAERIHQAALRASSIIERLLRFARPSEQREFTSLNLVQAVEDALVLVGNQLRLGKVRLQKRFPDAPLLVLGSAGLIQQLVTNLVLNAVNAMPRKGGRIVVDLETENAHVHLRVADTGKGIRPPDLPKVFDPFFTTMPAGKGTGLGLSICYAIVRLHHGTIDLASRPRSGTTVTVTLPLAQEQSLT
jgi:signal transduction histidine kinase